MKTAWKGHAAVGIALCFGDTPEGFRALAALACNRCAQLDCDGYPCTPWEVEEMEQAERDAQPNPDASWDEVCTMLDDPGLVVPVGDVERCQ